MNKRRPGLDKDQKLSIKRVGIALCWLFPVIILVSYIFGIVLRLNEWLVVFINVIVGGFVCLLIYFIFDRIDRKRKVDELLSDDKDKYDPFKD